MFGFNKKETPTELKFEEQINGIEVDLLFGDLPSYIDKLKPSLGSLSREEKFALNDKGFHTAKLNKAEVHKVLSLWFALEKGKPMRCFSPGYRIKFLSDQQIVKTASICWQCNHIKLVDASGTENWFSFNGATQTAQDLLAKCRNAIESEL